MSTPFTRHKLRIFNIGQKIYRTLNDNDTEITREGAEALAGMLIRFPANAPILQFEDTLYRFVLTGETDLRIFKETM